MTITDASGNSVALLDAVPGTMYTQLSYLGGNQVKVEDLTNNPVAVRQRPSWLEVELVGDVDKEVVFHESDVVTIETADLHGWASCIGWLRRCLVTLFAPQSQLLVNRSVREREDDAFFVRLERV